MEDKLILKFSHLKLHILSTLTVCGSALLLLSGHAAADQNVNNQQTRQQNINQQNQTSNNSNLDLSVSPNNGINPDNPVQSTPDYNVVPSQSTDTNQVKNTTPANNYGYLDSVSLSNNQLSVAGWQATNQASDKPYHYVIAYDNTAKTEIGRQQVENVSRPDVAKAHPDATNAADSGFNTTIKLNVANDSEYTGHSISVLSRYSNDTKGNGQYIDYWYPAFTFDQGNYAYLDNVYTDNNNQLHVQGWNATNQATNKNYHYVILYDQTAGREVSRQLVNAANSYRPDVAKAYKNISNADRSGFNVTFNLNQLKFNANDRLQIVSRYSDAANGEGHRVDYWFAPANRDNEGYLDSYNLSNGNLVVNGWHADDVSQVEPNHFLILYDRTANRQVGVVKAEQTTRTDVAKAYKNIMTAAKSGFKGTFNVSSMTPGHKYSIVSRYSTSAAGNGGYGQHTDYWFDNIDLNKQSYSIDSLTATNNGFHITGWMASDNAINRPNAYLILLDNGKEVARTKVNLTNRADVAVVNPEIYNSRQSGFNTDLVVNPDRLSGNLQIIMRFSGSADGNSNYTDQYSHEYITNAGNFDSIQVANNQIKVSGWHASSQDADKPYQFIIALDQNGHELARQAIVSTKLARPDVQKVYPWIINSDLSGFTATISTSNLQHKVVRLIHRYSNQANGEGSYVDYYSNPVSVNSQFQKINGVTVYYDPTTGVKRTGWVKVNNNSYYFNPANGAMFTGIHTVDGKSYNFGSNGIAVLNDVWGWPFPADGQGHFSGAQLFGVNPGGQFRLNGFHDGLDFGSIDHPGAQVHAIHSGTVTQVGYTAGLDWYVLVDTGEYLTVYQEAFANRGDINVHVGQHVNTGDIIGRRDTAHVHIGITRQHNFNIALANSFNNNGTWLNPLTIIRNGLK